MTGTCSTCTHFLPAVEYVPAHYVLDETTGPLGVWRMQDAVYPRTTGCAYIERDPDPAVRVQLPYDDILDGWLEIVRPDDFGCIHYTPKEPR